MISIITINFNNGPGLLNTLESLYRQCNAGFEHVIIDGGSQDQSVEIIKLFSSKYNNIKWLSEPDLGIYDAMNKGIKLASARYIAFLNSGDRITDISVISTIREKISENKFPDMIYGNVRFMNEENKIARIWRSGNFNRVKLYLGWMPPHPLTFIKRDLFIHHGYFDISYKIAADYALMLKVLLEKECEILYIDEFFVDMELGGISNSSVRNILYSNYEVLKCWRKQVNIIPFWIFLLKPLNKLLQLKFF